MGTLPVNFKRSVKRAGDMAREIDRENIVARTRKDFTEMAELFQLVDCLKDTRDRKRLGDGATSLPLAHR